MSRRPEMDLDAIIAGAAQVAEPMREAVQRGEKGKTRTENLEALAFKVSPEFRKRFKTLALNADLKLNELLFQSLDAWEKQRNI
jgi:hypothetical protein